MACQTNTLSKQKFGLRIKTVEILGKVFEEIYLLV